MEPNLRQSSIRPKGQGVFILAQSFALLRPFSGERDIWEWENVSFQSRRSIRESEKDNGRRMRYPGMLDHLEVKSSIESKDFLMASLEEKADDSSVLEKNMFPKASKECVLCLEREEREDDCKYLFF